MLSLVLAFGAAALFAGVLLLWRVPLCPRITQLHSAHVSVLIPARNEEGNLPRLLNSIRTAHDFLHEVIVIDDSSTDTTAAVAVAGGAIVLAAMPLQPGWTGKTWACAQGAERSKADTLLFLDADTWLLEQGFDRVVSAYAAHGDERVALSILPFHVTEELYEELSLFFNLLMAFGAGGFGLLGAPRLFGQSLLLTRALYESSGGHAAVRHQVLENFAMSERIKAAGGRCVCFGGRGVLHVRMFPDGANQLWESWGKAFADGAAGSDGLILTLAIGWLFGLCAILLMLLFVPGAYRIAAATVYACVALEVWWFARQIGTFRWYTCLLYPVPLLFFFALFAHSLTRRILRRPVSWRGRQL